MDTQGGVKRKAEGGRRKAEGGRRKAEGGEAERRLFAFLLLPYASRFFKPEIRKPPAFYLEAIAKMARRLAFVRWRVELILWK